jgi:hypothetical protein
MPKKPLSAMTAQQFVEYTGALGDYKDLRPLLGKSQPTISCYATGRHPIPLEVANKLHDLIVERASKLRQMGEQIHATNMEAMVSSLIVYQNEHKDRSLPYHTEARFMRRQLDQDTRTYPAYRMTLERYQIYVRALASWRDRVRELAREHTDKARQRDYTLELADIKAMADCAPRCAPYDVLIQYNEWDVVSRALRHLGKADPNLYLPTEALRQHWSRHRGSGYPKHRT